MTPIVLSVANLALAAGLVLLTAALSLVLSLRIHKPLLISAVRMVVQLVLVGLILRVVFASASVWLTVAIVGAMLAAAGREVGARSRRRLNGWWHLLIGLVSVTAATLPVVLVVLTTALKPDPWYEARHAIPLVGIVLGNVLNAASLALSAMLASAARERLAIEAHLALGATRTEAFAPLLRQAIRTGVTPTINTMAAAGIITMPGIMTGQVLAGMDPLDAAKYQILLMFVLATGGFLGSTIATYAALTRLTDERHRLRLDRLAPE